MDFQATILVAAQTLALSSPGGGGDFFRWIPATMYFVSAVFCLLAGLAERSVGNRRASPHTGVTEFRAEQPPLARNPGPRFWWPLASFLFLFGIERAFDLLSMLTDYGRGNAVAHAWYGSRRTYQGAFISAVVVLGAVLCVGLIRIFRRAGRRHHLAIAAFVGLSAFIAIRATSLHQVDSLLGKRMTGLKLNWIIELSGVIALAIAAVASIRAAGAAPDDHSGARAGRIPGR